MPWTRICWNVEGKLDIPFFCNFCLILKIKQEINNIIASENGRLENDRFLLGWPPGRCKLLVSRSVYPHFWWKWGCYFCVNILCTLSPFFGGTNRRGQGLKIQCFVGCRELKPHRSRFWGWLARLLGICPPSFCKIATVPAWGRIWVLGFPRGCVPLVMASEGSGGPPFQQKKTDLGFSPNFCMSPSGNFYITSSGPPVLCQDLETHHFSSLPKISIRIRITSIISTSNLT